MKYTKNDAVKAYELLRNTLGRAEAKRYNQIGAWKLDYNYVYGGYVIHQIDNIHGGVLCPMGTDRKTAREFVRAIHFALDVLRADKI
jgi:hypothetical protein